jgi:hypothetical protein
MIPSGSSHAKAKQKGIAILSDHVIARSTVFPLRRLFMPPALGSKNLNQRAFSAAKWAVISAALGRCA